MHPGNDVSRYKLLFSGYSAEVIILAEEQPPIRRSTLILDESPMIPAREDEIPSDSMCLAAQMARKNMPCLNISLALESHVSAGAKRDAKPHVTQLHYSAGSRSREKLCGRHWNWFQRQNFRAFQIFSGALMRTTSSSKREIERERERERVITGLLPPSFRFHLVSWLYYWPRRLASYE